MAVILVLTFKPATNYKLSALHADTLILPDTCPRDCTNLSSNELHHRRLAVLQIRIGEKSTELQDTFKWPQASYQSFQTLEMWARQDLMTVVSACSHKNDSPRKFRTAIQPLILDSWIPGPVHRELGHVRSNVTPKMADSQMETPSYN